jgi:alpha-N-arabinofuranosidase
MKLQDPTIRLIVAGVGGNMKWNRTVLDSIHPVADYISAHWYLRAPDYPLLLDRVSAFERQITEWEGFLAAYPAKPENYSQWYRFPHRQGKVRLAIDEWGLWAGGQGGREKNWNLDQTYTWQDALAVASWLNAMQRHSEIIGFATWAQMVNIIAPIQADKDGSIRQTVFHPLALFAKHSRTWNVAVRCDSPPLADRKLPALDVAASAADQGGGLTVSIVNRHPTQPVTVLVDPGDAKLTMTGCTELTAPALKAANHLTRREQDCVRRRELPAASGPVKLTLPAASVTVVLFAANKP